MKEPEPGEIVTDGKSVNIGAPVVRAAAKTETQDTEAETSDDNKEE